VRSNFLRRGKLSRRDYLDYLKNRAKSGDTAVLDFTFRNVSLGKSIERPPPPRGGRKTKKSKKKNGPGRMAETPRAGMGDFACRK